MLVVGVGVIVLVGVTVGVGVGQGYTMLHTSQFNSPKLAMTKSPGSPTGVGSEMIVQHSIEPVKFTAIVSNATGVLPSKKLMFWSVSSILLSQQF